MDTGKGFLQFQSCLMVGAHGRGNEPQRREEELPHGIANTFQAKVESGANSRSQLIVVDKPGEYSHCCSACLRETPPSVLVEQEEETALTDRLPAP